jgi:hypothetical protein
LLVPSRKCHRWYVHGHLLGIRPTSPQTPAVTLHRLCWSTGDDMGATGHAQAVVMGARGLQCPDGVSADVEASADVYHDRRNHSYCATATRTLDIAGFDCRCS